MPIKDNKADKTLEAILRDHALVIPDYQRGYSWGEEQWKDFLDDLSRIPAGEPQYMGVLTMQRGADTNEFTVVDGQQRLTTILILCAALRQRLTQEQGWQNGNGDLLDPLDNLLWSNAPDRTPRLRYAALQEEYKTLVLIFRWEEIEYSGNQSVYSANLRAAAKHFLSHLQGKGIQEVVTLGRQLLGFLCFEPIFIDEWQAFIVFECLNNRGKKLSMMELLKNRLLYLSTLLPAPNGQVDPLATRRQIRDKVNEVWGHVYKQLGMIQIGEEEPDTSFLRDHWIMRWARKRSKGDAFKEHLLGEVFHARRVTAKRTDWRYRQADIRDPRRLISDLRSPKGEDDRKNNLRAIWDTCRKSQELVGEGLSNTDEEALRDAILADLNSWLATGGAVQKERREEMDKLLEQYLTKAESGPLDADEVGRYCDNLKESVDCWVCQFRPDLLPSLLPEVLDLNETKTWIRRLSDLECGYARPLLMAVLLRLRQQSNEATVLLTNRILARLERLAFLDELIGRPNTRDKVQALAREFWKKTHGNGATETPWVETAEELDKIANHSKDIYDDLVKRVKERYQAAKRDGFYGLGTALSYLLREYEYELRLAAMNDNQGLFNAYLEPGRPGQLSVEHVFPQNTDDGDWQEFPAAGGADDGGKRQILLHSLGNLVYVTSRFNRQVSNHAYAYKRAAYRMPAPPNAGGPIDQAAADGLPQPSGTMGTAKIAENDNWTPVQIRDRGLELLTFIEKRWSVCLGNVAEKVALLRLSFVDPQTQPTPVALPLQMQDRPLATITTLRGRNNMLRNLEQFAPPATLAQLVATWQVAPFAFYDDRGIDTILQYEDLVVAVRNGDEEKLNKMLPNTWAGVLNGFFSGLAIQDIEILRLFFLENRAGPYVARQVFPNAGDLDIAKNRVNNARVAARQNVGSANKLFEQTAREAVAQLWANPPDLGGHFNAINENWRELVRGILLADL